METTTTPEDTKGSLRWQPTPGEHHSHFISNPLLIENSFSAFNLYFAMVGRWRLTLWIEGMLYSKTLESRQEGEDLAQAVYENPGLLKTDFVKGGPY